jgi:phosphomannomutase
MTLIKSISGIRGTIGGKPGDGLSPVDVVKFVAAYTQILENTSKHKMKIVVGRDARTSGEMVDKIVCGALMSMGTDVVNLGLSTTPTVEIAVTSLNADGGIIITASHNPGQWNALKFLNEKGEFISAAEGEKLLEIAENDAYKFSAADKMGTISYDDTFIDKHIELICKLKLVDVQAIKKAGFKVAIDAVNSTGGIAIPKLLKALGVAEVIELYTDPTGVFPHNPEPLPENLEEISSLVVKKKANVGFVVDPDVDRLAIICENGEMFGEEYTLVAVADYVLKNNKGNTVSNLSSTQALADVTIKNGGNYSASAVGEVNVVSLMKTTEAVIGGEGNGGVIYPELHYGRDALVGIALFLTHLAKSGKSCMALRDTYPKYFIAKKKITLSEGMDTEFIINKMKEHYKSYPCNSIDGLKITFDNDWVHLRRSNTEPIIRIYSESNSMSKAENLAKKVISDIGAIILGNE